MTIRVLQVIPRPDYTVYIYFSDGRVKRYDARPVAGKGVFASLEDVDFFIDRCTVLNGTLAWDRSGRYDEASCIDIDPETLYNESVEVDDPRADIA
jgi:hypothetical protein